MCFVQANETKIDIIINLDGFLCANVKYVMNDKTKIQNQ